ncbi:hypothetical protein LTV02_17970 [Nocardia yamanashiensis]|uniref:DUF2637 domain-containing protein n=1 Tax=Nocardia yamanashiensis TaxID=209247 RepID=UPI001E443470|nr:DUF2637 domain-containing protein [Nocardia yamanashiensis]UGT45159.1 hypothetical protein LTV02_17970 [Nocardia yamanashiensis]
MTTTQEKTRGQLVAWAGFVFGSLTSIAANVLHTWLPVDRMPPEWTPGIAPQIGAAVWPIGLLLSVEVLSRAAWRSGGWWAIARYGGAGTVALGSAVISYGHVREVLLAWGYGHPAAEFGPLTLDGLMVVSGFALLSMTPRRDTEHHRTAPRFRIREPEPAIPHEVPLTVQVEPAAPNDIHPAEVVATVSGQNPEGVATEVDMPPAQADATAEGADSGEGIEADSRRQRARELHALGWTHARIAAELAVSKRTVRRYLSSGADTDGHADSPEDTADLFGPDWLTALDTNHHDNHEGVLS